jgi:hypothetical protein
MLVLCTSMVFKSLILTAKRLIMITQRVIILCFAQAWKKKEAHDCNPLGYHVALFKSKV